MENRWESEIIAFEEQDETKFPVSGGTVFTGSSTIRLWKTLEQDFPGKNVINRGFGGAKMKDVIYYISRIITPYKPNKVFLYPGGNDLTVGKMPEVIGTQAIEFAETIHKYLPNTSVNFISILPHRFFWDIKVKNIIDRINKVNEIIKLYTKTNINLSFVDVFSPMIALDQPPPKDLFGDDEIHLNKKGYKFLVEKVAPFV